MKCVQQEEGELGKICENLTKVYVSHSATVYKGVSCVLVKVVLGHNQDAVKSGGEGSRRSGGGGVGQKGGGK